MAQGTAWNHTERLNFATLCVFTISFCNDITHCTGSKCFFNLAASDDPGAHGDLSSKWRHLSWLYVVILWFRPKMHKFSQFEINLIHGLLYLSVIKIWREKNWSDPSASHHVNFLTTNENKFAEHLNFQLCDVHQSEIAEWV